jgi:hypothetical protein
MVLNTVRPVMTGVQQSDEHRRHFSSILTRTRRHEMMLAGLRVTSLDTDKPCEYSLQKMKQKLDAIWAPRQRRIPAAIRTRLPSPRARHCVPCWR